MSAIRRFLLWYGLLSKRLLRRSAYLAVLALVPLFCVAILFFSRQDSGVVTVALHCADPADPVSHAAVERLLEQDSLIRYLPCDGEPQAREAVERGRADAAWLFRADAAHQLDAFARGSGGTVVTVVEREDNVFLMLAREKLFAALYPELSASIFSQFLNGDPGAQGYYSSGTTDQQVLRFATASGEAIGRPDHYLVVPLRGILALLLMLSGFASAMYCYREEQNGSFIWLSGPKRRLLPILCHLTAILPTAGAVYIAMALTGVLTSPLRELLLLVLLSLAAALFCELARCLAGQAAYLGALIPLLLIAMLVCCPVFADLEFLHLPGYLFPPFYYLRAVFSQTGLLSLAAYTALLALVTLPLTHLRKMRL